MITLYSAFAAGACVNSAIWSASNGEYFIAAVMFATGVISAFAAIWWRYD